MLQARGRSAARRVVEVKGPPSSAWQLAFILFSTLALMTLYEVAKSLLFPAITLWESHVITIVVSTIVATAAASLVLRKLRHSEDSYRRLVEMSLDAVWVHRQGTIIIANSACATLFGASTPDELLGKHVLDFAHPDNRETIRIRLQNHLDDSNPLRHYESKHVRLDGRVMDVEVVVCSIIYQGEAASLAMFHDISERKLAGQKLLESEANLAAAQRIAHLGSWTLELNRLDDLNENPLRWSDELYRIFGYEVGQLEVSRPNFLRAVHPEDRDSINEGLANALRDRKGYSTEYRIARPNGVERIIQGRADIVIDERSGRKAGPIGVDCRVFR